jgi:limonene-1,2-epoxide hydrolase
MSNIEVVKTFVDAWSRLDLHGIESIVSDDLFYQNIPFAAVAQLDELTAFEDSVRAMLKAGDGGMPITPIIGRPAFKRFLGIIKLFEWAKWDIKSIAADGDTVFTERLDTFGFQGGGSIAIGVIGLFEVRGGLIHGWRDYFSLAEFQSQMPQSG